jgi:FERM, RhoGEF and pleckstrin domain protein 2
MPAEESYCIVKELLMTERTYKKDLNLLTTSFRNFAVTNNFDLKELTLFDHLLAQSLEPLNEFHSQFLKDIEGRIYEWAHNQTNSTQRIGDLLLNISRILKCYTYFIDKLDDILTELESNNRKNKRFESLFKDFESQKICYLPFSMFLLKPIQRIIHYKTLLQRLLIYYGVKHCDYEDTHKTFNKIETLISLINNKLFDIENKQKLLELQRDLVGIDNLMLNSGKMSRVFVREGSLQKLSRKGYQQRMFFLFNNCLLYCARNSNQVLQFKVHGEYNLKTLQIEDGNTHINIPNSFTIYSSNRSILVAAV